MPRRSFAACLLVIAVLVGACTGDDDDDGGADGGNTPSAEDQEAVEGIVLTADDLPEGWSVSDEEDTDEDDELQFPEECTELEAALGDDEFEGQTAEAESDTFVRGDLETDDSEVQLLATVVAAEDDDALADSMEPLGDDDLPQCLADALAASFEALGEGIEFADIDVTSPAPPDLGDGGVAFHVETGFTVQGVQFPVALDILMIREGRFGISVAVTTLGRAPSSAEIEDLVAVMIDRAADAA